MPDKKIYNILVVEDSDAEMRLMQEAMRLSKLDTMSVVSLCYTTEEGMETLEQSISDNTSFDVIFLDLNVPKIGGVQLLKWIKAKKELAGIPVFVLTNSDHREDIMACMKYAADAYFQKPPDFGKFIDFFVAIRKSLERDSYVSLPYIQQQYNEMKRA